VVNGRKSLWRKDKDGFWGNFCHGESDSGQNVEGDVAVQRSAWCRDLDRACGCTVWYGGFDVSVGNDLELRWSAVEGDGAGFRQLISQNLDYSSRLSESGVREYEWFETKTNLEYGAAVDAEGSAQVRCAVDLPVRGLEQSPDRFVSVTSLEAMQRFELALWSDFENRSAIAVTIFLGILYEATRVSGAIEVPIAPQR